MGACSGHDIVQKEDAKDFKEAYDSLVSSALEYSGTDPYNGTISTPQGCREIDCPKEWQEWLGPERSKFVDSLLDECEKWGPAVGFTTPDGNFVFSYWAAE